MSDRPSLGMCFTRTLPAAYVVDVAERLEADGVDQLWVIEDRARAYEEMAPFVGELLDSAEQGITHHPHFDDLRDRYADGGVDALASMPVDWWRELGAIGTVDDVRHHIEALHDVGADDVVMFPAPDLDTVREQLDDVAALVHR